jgi:hypothetical protein
MLPRYGAGDGSGFPGWSAATNDRQPSWEWTETMSIAPVSHAPPPAVAPAQAAKVAPFKRDRDGDHDNNRVETKAGEAAETAKDGRLLNIKA